MWLGAFAVMVLLWFGCALPNPVGPIPGRFPSSTLSGNTHQRGFKVPALHFSSAHSAEKPTKPSAFLSGQAGR
jgi:hypothetical protein